MARSTTSCSRPTRHVKFIYKIDGINGDCASWTAQISLIIGCYTHGEPGLRSVLKVTGCRSGQIDLCCR